jgi:hypothetical protein
LLKVDVTPLASFKTRLEEGRQKLEDARAAIK